MNLEEDPDAATFYAQAAAMGCASAAASEVAQGGGGGGQPDPLQCFFTGATFPTPGWGGTDVSGFGYYVPAELNFTATGGNGTYTWGNANNQPYNQIRIYGGTVTYSGGRTVNMATTFPARKETLSNIAPPGPNATFFDSPGIQSCANGSLGCIVSANITWTFILTVQVSSGGQTVNCPTVVWQVQETWAGFMIGIDPIQWASGSGTVLSP
jgi:hypothetical protein